MGNRVRLALRVADLARWDSAVRHVDRAHPGVLCTPDVVEETVADVDAGGWVVDPTASIAARNASGDGLVHGTSLV